MNYLLKPYCRKSHLLIIAVFLIFFSQEAVASVSYQEPPQKTIKAKRYSRLKKVSNRKVRKKTGKIKKIQRESSFIGILALFAAVLFILGIILFIVGLTSQMLALWIIGLCFFGLPILAFILLLLGITFSNAFE